MNRQISLFAVTVAILLATPHLVMAQSPGAAQANSAAYDLYAAGDFKNAALAYEKLLKDYPTDSVIPLVQVQAAFCYYFLARYDDAVAVLQKAMAGPPLPPDLKQNIDSFTPQILAAKASTFGPDDAQRESAFGDSIKKYDYYITTYPKAEDLENAIFGRAVAKFQIKKYDDAVADLQLNLQKFPQSNTITTSKNLLALTLAVQGSQELNKKESVDKDKAFGLYKQAADYLREIINKKEDVALINEANFQLGEILFNQAAFSADADKPALFQQALEAYRAVAPKAQILDWQNQVLAAFPDRKRQVLLQHGDLKQLNKDLEREQKKLAELQGKPDEVATALLKMGEIYYQQNKPDEARVVLQHVKPYLQGDNDNKRDQYFVTMTYALQKAAVPAAAGYEEFQAKFKGDPLADNLPFAIGSMYLGQNKLDEANKYFDESLDIYPTGRFAGLSVVSKADAQVRAKQFDEAAKTFQDALAKNPTPEIGVVAQNGLANIAKDTKQWDQAIAAYQKVKDTYPTFQQAKDADYWIGICTQQKGDNAAAIPLLDAYVKAYPKSPLAPLALYTEGAAQIALGQTEPGIATMAAVADQYPDSQPAPFTYFTRAQLRAKDNKGDEMIALMKAFIAKYPKDNKVFTAYQSIAGVLMAGGNTDDALAAYREYVQNYPDSPQAAEALVLIAGIQRDKASGLGRYGALKPDEQSLWKTLVDGSVAAIEELIKKYPESPSLPAGLDILVQDQRLLVTAELKKSPDLVTYFQALADASTSPTAKSNTLFTLASYVNDDDKAKALSIMDGAYNAEVIYSPATLDLYGLSLVDAKKYDEAEAVYEKMAKDYPVPAGMTPDKTPIIISTAQAASLFGRGRIAQDKGDVAGSGDLFGQLKSLYPWSPKVFEANYGIAAALQAQGKYDDALTLLRGVLGINSNASNNLRAKSMLLSGKIDLDKMKAATTAKDKDEFLAAAIDNSLKVANNYAAEKAIAAEGLWFGSQLLEQQAGDAADPAFKKQQLDRAGLFYKQLVHDYPESEFAPKAQDRLTALGVK